MLLILQEILNNLSFDNAQREYDDSEEVMNQKKSAKEKKHFPSAQSSLCPIF